MKRSPLSLKNGSRISIVGGGPAGAFFAHFIHKMVIQSGLYLPVTIFDGKHFLQKGPKGCNLCAGVIAESLNQKLIEENLLLPEKRIVNRIDGYCFHVDGENLFLSCEENKKNKIATVFRGNGPRYSNFPETISFDDFLLTWAQDQGAQVISEPVWDIFLPEDKQKPVDVYYGKNNQKKKLEADLVVGAFGVNTYLMKKIQNLGFGYEPPRTLITYQAELKLGREYILKQFGNNIHIYMPKSKTLRYASVIPKQDFITITLIGKNNASTGIFKEFLDLKGVQNKIPNLKPHCFCYPRITISPSKKPFTDRFVMVGDASFSRHYKNGIESAFVSAKLAAEAAIFSGIDTASFSDHYYGPAKKRIVHDNRYGQFLFFLNDLISSVPILTQSHLTLAKQMDNRNSPRKIRSILWNIFTGNIPYKEIFKKTFDLGLQISLSLLTMSLLVRKIKGLITRLDLYN
ncbi:NAD(P)/FAD-dependent oxidoreductase [Acidobacteriota bacterium]